MTWVATQRFVPTPRVTLARFGPDRAARRAVSQAVQNNVAPSISAFAAAPAGGSSFEHTQNEPSALWIINHNLSRFVDVTVTDLAGNEFGADVQRFNPDQVRIILASPAVGRVLIR